MRPRFFDMDEGYYLMIHLIWGGECRKIAPRRHFFFSTYWEVESVDLRPRGIPQQREPGNLPPDGWIGRGEGHLDYRIFSAVNYLFFL